MVLSEAYIASRIASLREEIVVLGKYHNANYAAAVKLPPEVLVQIFEGLARAPKSPQSEEHPRAHYAWIKEVTHVCSAWRSVALATPLLWTSVLLRPNEWAEQVLQRALGVPLDLEFPMLEFTPKPATAPKETDTDLIKLAFSHPQNIRSVDIAFQGYMSNEAMKLMCSLVPEAPLPHLERLHVSSQSIQPEIPDELFSQSRLRYLSLERCVANLTTPRFSLLHTLRLVLDPRHIGITAVLDAISAMPELEVFFFQDVGYFSRTIKIDDTQEPVEMPSLREITIKSTFPEIADIFKVLIAPVVRSVVWDTDEIEDIQSILHVYSFLHIDHLSPTPASQSLTITEIEEEDFLLLHSSTSQNGEDKTLSISSIILDLNLLWTSIPKQNVKSVVLIANRHASSLPSPLMRAIIASLAHVLTLNTLQVPYLSFVQVSASKSWQTAPVLPSLQSLTLDCHFTLIPQKAFLDKFKRWIQLQEHGSPNIPHITLRGYFTKSTVAELESLFGELVTVQSLE